MHKFEGTVTIDGAKADGTTVTAFVDGLKVASSRSIRGRYFLSVTETTRTKFSGKIISFEISGNPVKSTAIWKAGASSRLDLSVKTARQVAPNPNVKPTLTPIPKPKALPTFTPTPRPKAGYEAQKTCSDIVEIFSAADDNGTVVMTLDRLPVSRGGTLMLTGTINYDGSQPVLREYHYDGSWEYLIQHRWEGVSPPLKGSPPRACTVSAVTPESAIKSTPKVSPNSVIKSTPESSPKSPNDPAKKRGFLVNRQIGSDVPFNKIDANTLSIIGIILTLITAGIPLFKGD